MACQTMNSWTFTGLVGAFLDLAVAYLLLCAATLAFFASKFLGFFGLCLPCPCNGLFGNPTSNCCSQRLLVDCPTETVSSVQLAIKSNFPFDSIWGKDRNYQLNLKFVRDRDNYVDEFVEMEGKAECSSISGTRKAENVTERDLVPRNELGMGLDVANSSVRIKEGRFDLKGKGVINQRPRSSLRRRRKGVTDYGKVSSGSSYAPSCADDQLPFSINCNGGEVIEQSPLPVDSGVDANRSHYDEEDQIMRYNRERALRGFELIEQLDENKPADNNASSFEEIEGNAQNELGFDGNEKNTIRILEQALEEEHAACAALYLELEKERSAAAIAADEAMAMILRLQEEKALIEMEARQYQRMIEEKYAYDAEEMNILKEIIVRRETETHFLEKEVEAYREMIYDGNQQLQDDGQSIMDTEIEQFASSLDLGEDPVLILQQLSECTEKKEIVKDKSSVDEILSIVSIDKQNCTLAVGENLQISGWDEEADISKQGDLDKQFSHVSGSSQEHLFSEKIITLSGKQQGQNDKAHEHKGMAIKTIETHIVTEKHIPCDGEYLEQHEKDVYQGSKDPGNTILDMEPRVHDVHVVDGESNLFDEVRGNKNEWPLENDTSYVQRIKDLPLQDSDVQRIDVTTDCPSTSGMVVEPDINRSSSDMGAGLPPLGGKSIFSDLQRNSMSAVENERSKIDSEVGWLRERLRIVQEGRGKLSFSTEHQERENCQLQLLEDIACQLREIRQLTEPGQAVRQASLPLPSSEVMSKKRHHRSVSLGVHKTL